jgi:hypothetical protein
MVLSVSSSVDIFNPRLDAMKKMESLRHLSIAENPALEDAPPKDTIPQ